MIHDLHPVMNMLPLPGEEEFAPETPNKLVYSYFRQEPWVETDGMEYLSGHYDSKAFTSFTHTMGDIITAVAEAGLAVRRLREFPYDVGLTDVYDGAGWPLSFLLTAQKAQPVQKIHTSPKGVLTCL